MVTGGDFTWDGEHTIHYTDDVLYNCTPETYIILLTNVTPINSIKPLEKYSTYKGDHTVFFFLCLTYFT